MRNFRKAMAATLGFVLCLALIAGIIVWPYFHGETFYYEDAGVRDELAGSIDTLVSGASHGACAFHSRVLDEALGVCSYNLSGPLMTMQARKTLLEKELDRNPVKTVFIELSCNALTRSRAKEGYEGELYALARMGSFRERVGYFFRAFEEEDYLGVWADTLQRGFDAWKSVLRKAPPVFDPADKGFLPRDPQDLRMDAQTFSGLHNTVAIDQEAFWDNKIPLMEMVELCQSRGVEVIFVTTPMSDRLLAQFTNLEEPRQWYLFYSQTYGCPYWDFNLYRDRDALFPDDTAFYDLYHLSEQGAETFTRELAAVYQKYRAGQDVSGLFYENYAALDAAMTEAYGMP